MIDTTDDKQILSPTQLAQMVAIKEGVDSSAVNLESMVQSLLQLADEADKQALLAAQAFTSANAVAREHINIIMMSQIADENDCHAAELAIEEQLSILQNHTLAVAKNMYYIDEANDLLTSLSQDISQLSNDMVLAQNDAALARKKAEQVSREYTDKQIYALGTTDEFAQAKNQIPQSYRTFELEQQWDRLAHQEFMLAQKEADLARKQAEQARLEYEDKQFHVLSIRDELAKANRTYDLGQSQIRQYNKNFEQEHQWAGSAKQEYLKMKEQLEELKQSQLQTPVAPTIAEEDNQELSRNRLSAISFVQEPTPTTMESFEQTAAATADMPITADPMEQAFVATPDIAMPNELLEQAPVASPDMTILAKQLEQAAAALEASLAVESQATAAAGMPAEAESAEQTVTAAPDTALAVESREQTDVAAATPKPVHKHKKIGARLLKIAIVLVIILVAATCLRMFVFDIVRVSGESMMPTLQNSKNLIIVNKLAYILREPKCCDIVMLDMPEDPSYLIKRIIGEPNQHIAITDGLVFINGEILIEEYLYNNYTDGKINSVIPYGCYYVMGDNRSDSHDSRQDNFGTVTRACIRGKAILLFYPLEQLKIL